MASKKAMKVGQEKSNYDMDAVKKNAKGGVFVSEEARGPRAGSRGGGEGGLSARASERQRESRRFRPSHTLPLRRS